MIDAAAQKSLQELFRRENRSFLQYVGQAAPWYRDGDRPLVEKIQNLAAEEAASLQDLAEWMDARGLSLPYLGAFPSSYANFNFIDIRKLLKPLVDEQRKELQSLEQEELSLANGEARQAIAGLLELNRKHLCAMEELSRLA